jgi:hypothetical protein
MVPEVISLRVWIGQVRFGHPKDPLADIHPAGRSVAKLFPIIKPTTSDYVVDGCKCPLRMIQMTVQHAADYSSLDAGNGSSSRARIRLTGDSTVRNLCNLRWI